MRNNASETDLTVVDGAGRRGHVAFIGNAEQLSRWAALGFNASAALDRQRAFATGFQAETDFKAAGRVLRAFLKSEQELAMAQSVPSDDPDLGRIEASAKAWHWEPARAAV